MMNIRAMDMQVLIPRTTEVGKMQQIANQQPSMDQQVFGEQLKQVTNQRQQQVQHTNKSEGSKVTREKDKEKGKDHSNKKEQPSPAEIVTEEEKASATILNRPSSSDPVRGHSIDIKT